jgi:energy-coupling factor transport system ATP-binding protein
MPGMAGNVLTLTNLEGALPACAGGPEIRDAAPFLAQEDGIAARAEIEVAGLEYVYLQGTPLEHCALRGVNLKAQPGEVHGLLGRTGSGKSTLMQHLNGLLRPQKGRVRVADFHLNDPKLDRREVVRRGGLVFQNPEAQFFEYYVGDEIAFGPRQLPTGEKLAERVRRAMQQVGLDFESFKDRPLATLSGGERRKVALASTLVLAPEILLLDEPTAGLDPASRRELLANLVKMQRDGLTIVLSSHQMDDLAILAQALTVFDQGKDVLTGSCEAVFAQGSKLQEHGLEAPLVTQIADVLRGKGWPVPLGVMREEQLAAAVAALAPGRAAA